MIKIIGLWMLFGLIIQAIGGMIGALQDNRFEKKIGMKYDTRYTDVMMYREVCKINPFANMINDGKIGSAKGFKSILLIVICNLYGYLIWPIYFPTMMLAYDKARNAFLNDHKEES